MEPWGTLLLWNMPWLGRLQVEFPQKSHYSWYRKGGKFTIFNSNIGSGILCGGMPGKSCNYLKGS